LAFRAYATQAQPRGVADAFNVGREFIGHDSVALVLGDNIFYGHGLPELLVKATKRTTGATIFGYPVNTPEQYGVIDLNSKGRPISIEEKPQQPKSNLAVTGLYFYDNDVVDIAAAIKPSHRGELEITDVNRVYLKRGSLHVHIMGRGFAWLDTGTHSSLVEASHFVQILEQRQGLRIACPEEIALRLGYISLDHFHAIAQKAAKSSYGDYLLSIHRSLGAIRNRPLLAFPEVKILDVLFASGLLEIMSACCVVITFLIIAWCAGIDAMPRDIIQASFAFGAAMLLGLGSGILNGVIALAAPPWFVGYTLTIMLLWVSSGIFFVPDALPALARDILAYNPLLQVIEWMRSAYYEGYGDLVLDRTYVLSVAAMTLFLGLLLERAMRGHLLAVR
jgi:glucose-1-phosphate thymidylyltransferase